MRPSDSPCAAASPSRRARPVHRRMLRHQRLRPQHCVPWRNCVRYRVQPWLYVQRHGVRSYVPASANMVRLSQTGVPDRGLAASTGPAIPGAQRTLRAWSPCSSLRPARPAASAPSWEHTPAPPALPATRPANWAQRPRARTAVPPSASRRTAAIARRSSGLRRRTQARVHSTPTSRRTRSSPCL